MNTHNGFIQAIAQWYNRQHEIPSIVEGHYVPVDTELAHRIADYYEQATVLDDSRLTKLCYKRLAIEVYQQYLFLIEHGITFEPWQQDGQPYANSAEMCLDVRNNLHLYFFTGGEPHPYLSESSGVVVNGIALSYNDLFRAVHDIFGHAAEGFQFGARGEENAWIHHSMMFSHLAQRALSTETRGQNSWVNFGPCSHLPVTERPYAIQKVFLLPTDLTDWQSALARQAI